MSDKTDIVERLRMPTAYGDDQRKEAADEIERLRYDYSILKCDYDALRANNERLRAALKECCAAVAKAALEPKP